MTAAIRPRPERARRGKRTVVIGALLCVLWGGSMLPGAAANPLQAPLPDPADDATASGAVMVEDLRLDPALWSVPADSAELRGALERQESTQAALTATIEERLAHRDRAAALGEAGARLDQRLAIARRRALKSTDRLAAVRSDLQGLAVAEYVRGGIGGPSDVALSGEGTATARRQRTLVRSAFGQRLADERANVAALEASVTLADTTAVELDAVRSELQAATEARDAAALREEQLGLELLADTATVADERVMAVALGTDMPLVVLDAYVRASRRMAFERPECRVPWSLLAGIGRTESRHGTFGGARVAATGEISEPILGIPLDGTRSALIADTDGGTLDGDLAFDRAVGPMQFIPSTWTRVARDATADGVADPHNLYDAALTAADYLCRAADGLDQEPGARRALLSYNRSVEYGTTVLDRARGYAEAVPIA